eukprot:1194651-Prorocentrum_minimum.AAC.14
MPLSNEGSSQTDVAVGERPDHATVTTSYCCTKPVHQETRGLTECNTPVLVSRRASMDFCGINVCRRSVAEAATSTKYWGKDYGILQGPILWETPLIVKGLS